MLLTDKQTEKQTNKPTKNILQDYTWGDLASL